MDTQSFGLCARRLAGHVGNEGTGEELSDGDAETGEQDEELYGLAPWTLV